MSEQDPQRERELPGGITITPSSDAAISHNLTIIRGEIEGVNSKTVDGELYETQMIGSATAVDNEVDILPETVSSRRKLGSSDSAYGSSIHNARQQRLKKAA